ncbi:hypothetical protein DM02DRAFT_241608 [Periconia macrospinosa]|uniref:Uncharacterized protein n=1 Tax=Periconia macrospinosa TaxID=97972 RepID=A0A2V1D5C6_9PLEO|nr:hypothetical protein DM02DRAFT_241608 [Periconia macrospinosa]
MIVKGQDKLRNGGATTVEGNVKKQRSRISQRTQQGWTGRVGRVGEEMRITEAYPSVTKTRIYRRGEKDRAERVATTGVDGCQSVTSLSVRDERNAQGLSFDGP